MYGYLGAPCGCRDARARAVYRRYFCGLCNVLARDCGPAARWLINRDSTALALLWGAQTATAPALSLATCCNPWGARRALCQSGAGMAFAAAVTVAGLETRAADQRADERGLRRWGWEGVVRMGGSFFERARRTLAALDFDLGIVTASLAAQTQVERAIVAGETGWQRAAEPTASLVGALVAHQARLAGNCGAQPHYARLGAEVGRMVYWLDACEDWVDDRRQVRFNPLPAPEAVNEVLPQALDAAATALAAAPLARHRSLLADVLITGPRRRFAQYQDGQEDAQHPAGEMHQPLRRRRQGAAPGPCDQTCAACGDCCTLGDSCCQSISCCNECCEHRGDPGCGCHGCGNCGCDSCGDGCCNCDCDCPCDSGGN